MPPERPIREIRAHTGLRGIAALTVFLAHAEFDHLWRGALWFTGIYRFFYWQNPAVDLFFMLSGFVLNYVYLKGRRVEWRSFFSARFARICPLYYAGLLAVILMNLVSARYGHLPSTNLAPQILLPNLAMLQQWPPFGSLPSIDVPSWSISVEVFLYIVIFPLCAFFFSRRSLSTALSLAVISIALALNGAFNTDSPLNIHFQYAGLLRGVTGFAAGFLICELRYKTDAPLISPVFEYCLAFVTIALLPFPFLHCLLPAAFAALIASTYSPASRLGSFLGSPFLHYLGGISYSIYIWQFPVLKACSLAFSMRHMGETGSDFTSCTFLQKLLFSAGTIVALAVVANLSYYAFENPARIFLRRPLREWFHAIPQSAKS